jgi:transposase
MGTRKQYSSEFKARVVLELLKEEKTVAQLSSEHGVHASMLHAWKAAALKELPGIFADRRSSEGIPRAKEAEHEGQVRELYAEIGKLSTQLAWLKKKSGIDNLPG